MMASTMTPQTQCGSIGLRITTPQAHNFFLYMALSPAQLQAKGHQLLMNDN